MEIIGKNGFIGTYLTKHFKLEDTATLIHLAGTFSSDFDILLRDNLQTTIDAVNNAKKHNLKLIFSSSGGIYGSALTKPWKESDTAKPDTLYGLSKLYAEQYINYSGITSTILRYPNVYGPHNAKGVIYSFLNEITQKGTVTILGNGEQRRDFLHVHDACTAIELASKSNEIGIFNVSNESFSLNEVVELLKRLFKKDFEVIHLPSDENNKLQNLNLDSTKIRSVLNWKPTISLEEGLSELILEFK